MLNHPASSREPEPSNFAHAGPPNDASRAPALSHRQAREQLALLLDATCDPTLRAALEQHVAQCAECALELDQLRAADAWFQAQPREVPEMIALEGATWATIQERLNQKPQKDWAALHAMFSPQEALPAEPQPAEPQPTGRHLVLVGKSSEEPETSESLDPLPQAPVSPSSTVPALPAHARPWLMRPQKVLVAVLAASFLMTSMAALFLAYLAQHPSPASPSSTLALSLADVLDPGNLTTALTFDPLSRHLFTLSSDQRFDCPRGMHCPGIRPCTALSSLDVETGKRTPALLPACATGTEAGEETAFADLLEDQAAGQVLAVSHNQWVMTYNSRASAPGVTYRLACCDAVNTPEAKTFIDQRDHLLLSAGVSPAGWTWQTLAAQDTQTGKIAYQKALPAEPVRGGQNNWALLSNVTGWLYLWTDCAAFASGICIEVYEAKNGSKVTAWQAQPDETPLAADPAQELLYVRHDADNGQSETLALDAKTGAVRGQLPAAEALAVNPQLHHAYLLSDAGVTVADTQSWQVLSTLPVLAYDADWTAPAVDVQLDRIYVPTVLGKVLKVQDTPDGRLSFGSPEEQAVLNADRVMENGGFRGQSALEPWQLPLGPGITSLSNIVWKKTDDGEAAYTVPAKLETSVTRLNGGNYSVLISLSWSHTSAALTSFTSTPLLQPSYPYNHTWRYHVPSTGDATLSEEHGDPLARCC